MLKPLFSIILSFVLLSTQAQETRKVDDAVGLMPGTSAPIFSAVDADSIEYSLEEALSEGPVVMIFYRGHWCPYCNQHLEQVQDSLQMISALGAMVVAISPQKLEYLNKMERKTRVEFRLLYDEDYKISDAYDVTFTPEMRQLKTYNTWLGAKLKKSQTDESQRLPIPATYIINQEGIIIWRQFDPDYHKRSSVMEILSVLSKMTT